MSSYYTDCLILSGCNELSDQRTGIWPFRKKSEADQCRDDCKEAGDNERRETKYEEDFHQVGQLYTDIDVEGNVSAGYYQGEAPDDYSTDIRETFTGDQITTSSQGDPALLYAVVALAGGLIYMGYRNA